MKLFMVSLGDLVKLYRHIIHIHANIYKKILQSQHRSSIFLSSAEIRSRLWRIDIKIVDPKSFRSICVFAEAL